MISYLYILCDIFLLFELRQISCPFLSFCLSFANKLLLAQNARKSAITKDEDIAVGPSEGSDVSLSSSCNEPLFDLYRPPLVDFHQYERTEQGTSNQVECMTR